MRDPASATFYRLWEEHREVIELHVGRAARTLPAIGPMMARAPKAELERARRSSIEAERRALLYGEWDDFLADRRARARSYAQAGVGFSEWFSLITVFREVFTEICLAQDPWVGRAAQVGLGRMLDIALPTLAETYLEEKQNSLDDAEGRLTILGRVFDEAPSGKLILQYDGGAAERFRVLHCNRFALEIGGETLQRARATGITEESGLPFMTPGLLARWRVATADREPESWTTTYERRFFECHAFGLGPEGVIAVVITDQTLRHRQLAVIKRHMREIERSNRELDDFAYIASHDLKSPLSDVRHLAEWLEEDLAEVLPDRSRRHLDLLVSRVGRMERLLDDLLAYSRVGRREEEASSFQFADVVDQTTSLLAVPDGFRIESEGDVAFDVPRAPLETVLRNLISNALKHHDREEGLVRVYARVDVESDDAIVTVSDDGPGIEPAYIERIFRIFQTLRPRDEVESSGVGLAIVKKAVEHHGGRISVVSEGRGAEFEFTWPTRWPKEGDLA